MITCSSCGQPVPAGNKFCGQCGVRVSEVRQTSQMQSLSSLMPTSLAQKIKTAATEIVGERREVTVLFAGLPVFADPGVVDSEDMYLVTDEAMRLLTEVIFKYEGTIDKYTGDGLMALFGAPVTHENDPERAVSAGLEMLAALQPLQRRMQSSYNLDLQLQVGLNTGQVIAGQVGGDLQMEYTVVGDTVNMAHRLYSAAVPGTVLVSYSTFQRTRPLFRYEGLPPFDVKGKPDPIRAFQPLGPRTKPGDVRGLPGLQVPMIGRQNALAELIDALAQVRRARSSRIVLITGQAGVGKTRLAREFRAAEAAAGVPFYQGVCQNLTRTKPMGLAVSLLRDIVELADTSPSGVQRDSLAAYVDQMGLSETDVLPYLIHMLGLKPKDPERDRHLGQLDHTVVSQLTYAAFRQVLLAETHATPIVLVLEDLHWVDPASRDLLEYLINSSQDVPLMLLLISRDNERERVIGPLISAAQNHVERPVDIQLHPLSTNEGQLLVKHLIQTEENDALKQLIVQRAEGNPFFAEEIVRMLIEGGGLVKREGVWRTTPQASELIREVPGTLNGLILARFDRLPADLRRALQRAAVLGPTFSYDLICKISDCRREDLAAQVHELEARQFLIPTLWGTEHGFGFRHALVQEVVYNTLLKRDSRALHEEVAQIIEQSPSWVSDERTQALAHHYSRGSDPSKAIPYLIAAGESAIRSCAYETAIEQFRQASALLQDQPECDGERFVYVQIGLGQALKFVGQYHSAFQSIHAALKRLLRLSLSTETVSLIPVLIQGLRELADIHIREGALERAIPHLEAGLDALGTNGSQVHEALWRSLIDRLAWARFRQGKLEEAFDLASSATLSLGASNRDDPITMASLENTLGGVRWRQGDLVEAIKHVERSLALYRSLGYAWGMANASVNLGVLYLSQGDWPAAAANLEQGEDLYTKIGHLQNRAHTLINLGTLRQWAGEHEAARVDLETSLSICQRLGDAWGTSLAQVNLGRLAVVQSRLDDAAAHAEMALELSPDIKAHQVEARWILALCQAEDDLEGALAAARLALSEARSSELSETEIDCCRVLGLLQAQAGEYLDAEVLLRESVDLCIQRDEPYQQGLALVELGHLYRRLAETDGVEHGQWQAKSRAAYADAAREFKSLGADHDLRIANEALRGLGGAELAEVPGAEDGARPAEIMPAQRESLLPEGEWHKVAVVWLTLSATQDADEEEIFEFIALVTPPLLAIADEYQGRAIRRQDGLTVIFGAPTALEDDAERAVETARQMAQYLYVLSQQPRFTFAASLAVSLGRAVAGRVGSAAYSDFVVQGEPVQMAQQVAEGAPAGAVWVTAAVHDVTERVFVYEAAYPEEGESPADLLWRLVRRRRQPAPARGLPGSQARFVGRTAALEAMTELAQNLTGGLGGLVWIEGEPGIGKSRLMREFAASIEAKNVPLWAGNCSPQKSGTSFAFFSDVVAQAVDVHPADPPACIRSKIDQALQAWPQDVGMARPYLEFLLGVWPEGPEGERLANLDPEQLRQQIFVALRRMCKSIADQQNLVIVLDDLHWIDPVSAELLAFLLTTVASSPIMFVCAQRRQGADTPNNRLVRLQQLIPSQTRAIRLERLSQAESEALLTDLLCGARLPDRTYADILAQSEGNPYFIEEYVRMLIEQDYLQQLDGKWGINPQKTEMEIHLPASLETLIRSRVDILPDELKDIMQCMAVLGIPVETSTLEAVIEGGSVEAKLRRLESRLLVCRGAELNQWTFNHSLIESVVYQAMLKVRRRALHERVVRALESLWAGFEADHAEELAYHSVRAEDHAKALVYLMRAGERATARYANEEAIAYFEEASQLMAEQPHVLAHLRWRLAAGLGDVYRSIGRYGDSKAALQDGVAVVESGELPEEFLPALIRRLGDTAQKLGDLDAACEYYGRALTLIGTPADAATQTEVARIRTGMAWARFLQGQFETARRDCEISLAQAGRAGALNDLAAAENLLGGIYFRMTDLTSAAQHTRRAMVLREQMGYTWGVAGTLSNLGVLAIAAGDWNKGRSFFERSLALRQEVGDVEGVAIAHNNLGTLLRDQGALDQAELHFRASLDIARPFEMLFHVANSTVGLAGVLLLQGEIDAAQKAIHESLAQAEAIGAQDTRAEIYRLQAEVLMARDAWDGARRAADKAAIQAAETGNRGQESAAYRALSEIERREGRLTAAYDALNRAEQLTAEMTDELEAGRVIAQRGRLYLQEGRHGEAEADLRAAKSVFMRLGANLDLQWVEDALFARDSHNILTLHP